MCPKSERLDPPLHTVASGSLSLTTACISCEAAARAEWKFREQDLMPRLGENDRAPAFTERPTDRHEFLTVPTHPLNRIDSQEFRVLLLRRLRLPLPLSSRRCRCGRLLHSYGHHRALCHSRGFGQEWVRGRECRSTNVPRGERQGVDQCGCAMWTCQCPSMMDVV